MIRTTLQLMRGRRGNLLGSLIAFTLAVTFMLATVTVMISARQGPGATVRFSATDLVVRVDAAKALGVPADGLPENVQPRLPVHDQDRIASVSGVKSIVPMTLFPAQVLTDDGTPVVVSGEAVPRGQAWSTAVLTPFTLRAGHAPGIAAEIVIDGNIARAGHIQVGDTVMVATAVAVSRYSVAGIAVCPNGAGLERQASVFFQDDRAETLAATDGAADVVGVFLRDGADRSKVAEAIRRVGGTRPLEVLGDDNRGEADVAAGRDMVSDISALFGVMAGFVGFVTIFVLASTFGFAVQQRRREIGLLRAIGYTPQQIRRSILVESLMIGLLGSAIGLVLSQLMTAAIVRIMVWWGKLPEGFHAAPSGVAVMIVIPAGIGIALLSAWLASRKTSKIRPLESLRQSAVPTPRLGFWRWSWGMLFLVAGGLSVAVAGSVPAVVGILLSLGVIISWAIACALLGPVIVRLGTRLIASLPALASNELDVLASHNTRHQSFRTASVVTPIVLAVGMITMVFGFAPTQEAATMQVTDKRMAADLYLVSETGVLPPDLFARVRRIPGVASVTVAVPVEIGFNDGNGNYSPYTVLAVDTKTIGTVMDLERTGGDLASFGPGTLVLNQMNEIDVPGSPGSSIRVMLPDGTTRDLKWVASARNLIGAGDALMSIDDLPAGYGVAQAMLKLEDGTSESAVRARLDTMRADGLAVTVLTHDQQVDGVRNSIRQQAWASNLIIGSAAAFGVLAAINTLVMSISERQREFALMRMIGATRSQVLRMIRMEAVFAAGMAIALGVVIGALSLVPVSVGITGSTGALRLSVAGLMISIIAAVLITLGTALVAVRSVLRPNIVTVMSTKA